MIDKKDIILEFMKDENYTPMKAKEIAIILALMQTKEDAGLSQTITGSSTNNFYEKNKGRTRDGMLKKATIVLLILFAILTNALGIVYVA